MWHWFLRLLSPGDPGGGQAGDPPVPGAPLKGAGAEPPKPASGDPAPAPAPSPEAGKTKEELEKIKAEAQKEAIDERKKRQDLETKVKELTASGEKLRQDLGKALGLIKDSDDPVKAAESATKKVEGLESRLKQVLVESALIGELAKSGAIDPARAAKLVPMESLKVDLDKGTVEGTAEAVKALLKDAPYLVKNVPPPPGGGAPPASDPNPKATSQEEYDKLKAAAAAGDQAARMKIVQGLPEFRKAGIKV